MFNWRAIVQIFAGICLHLTYGIIFTWGNFSRFSTNMDDSAWGFALGIIGLASSMWSGAIIERKLGPKLPCIISGVIMTVAMFLTYFLCEWYIPTILVYSFLIACASGIAYSTPLSVGMRWLPHSKGLVNGCIVAGYGGSAFIFNQIQTAYINPNNYVLKEGEEYYPYDVVKRVPTSFLVMGGIFAALQILGCVLIDDPPHIKKHHHLIANEHTDEAHILEMGTPISPIDTTTPTPHHSEGYSVIEALKKPSFYCIFFMFLFNGFTTTISSSYYKTMGEERVTRNGTFLTWVGSFSALFNALGRILWGISNDHIGAKYSHMLVSIICSIASFLFYYLNMNWLYACIVCILFFCIGGMNSIFPTGTANYFGQQNFGTIYGIIYSSQVFSSCISSFSASSLKKTIGLEVGCGNAISLLINIIFFRPTSWRDDTKILGGDKHIKVSISSSQSMDYENPTEHEIEKEANLSKLTKQGSSIGAALRNQKSNIGSVLSRAGSTIKDGSKLVKQGSTISEKPKMTMRRANSSVTEDPPKLSTQGSTIKDNNPKLSTQGSTIKDNNPKLVKQTSKIPPKTPLKTPMKNQPAKSADIILPSTPQMNNLFSNGTPIVTATTTAIDENNNENESSEK